MGDDMTQAEMTEKSYDIFRENRDRMFVLVERLKPYLDSEQQSLLDESQLKLFEYMEAEAQFAASIFEGGSIAPLVFNMRQTSIIESRIIEIENLILINCKT